MSHLKSDAGAARLMVRGMPAERFTVTLKALGLNILRCAKALTARFLVRITLSRHKNMFSIRASSLLYTFRVFPFQKTYFVSLLE